MRLKFKLWLDYYVGGLLLGFLKIPTMILGQLMGRDHDLVNCRTVTYLKMMGGGSLVISYPALLALKQNPKIERLQLLTTPAIRPFAESLGVFDEIIVIRDRSLPLLVGDSCRALIRLFRTDAIIDLEIYSRLTTIFALLTCARNRVCFYTNASFWRKNISTHLLFCNITNGIYESYDQVARLFNAEPTPISICRQEFRHHLNVGDRHPGDCKRIGVAPGCSDLSKERMLRTEEWVKILLAKAKPGNCSFEFLGGPGDKEIIRQIREQLPSGLQGVSFAGQLALIDSVRRVAEIDELVCIDSALLHYARLCGTPVDVYMGPTDPRVLLRPMEPNHDTIHYLRIACSPCIHLATEPPCNGDNICMRYAADPDSPGTRNPIWIQH